MEIINLGFDRITTESVPLTKEELDEIQRDWERDKDNLTCKDCEWRDECEFTDDPYNTGGDCLAMK